MIRALPENQEAMFYYIINVTKIYAISCGVQWWQKLIQQGAIS